MSGTCANCGIGAPADQLAPPSLLVYTAQRFRPPIGNEWLPATRYVRSVGLATTVGSFSSLLVTPTGTSRSLGESAWPGAPIRDLPPISVTPSEAASASEAPVGGLRETTPTITLTVYNLPAGSYAFTVRARNANGYGRPSQLSASIAVAAADRIAVDDARWRPDEPDHGGVAGPLAVTNSPRWQGRVRRGVRPAGRTP